ncbi:MAG: type IX secretion system sortase PorU, partial [Sphingobacteriales bacterium]
YLKTYFIDTGTVTLKNVRAEKFDGRLPEGITVAENNISPSFFWGIQQKQLKAGFKLPLYYRQDGQVYKVQAFDMEVNEEKPSKILARDYVVNSVLSTGNWYKIAVDKRGIFKIDYNLLQSLGINPATVNPAHIRVYGNGGQVMPEAVNDGSYDDLVENEIEVHAGGGSFGQNDYVLFYANGPVQWSPSNNAKDFQHKQNPYEDKSYYFINVDLGAGKRVATASAVPGTAATTITRFDAYSLIEQDTVNLGKIGKEWLGQRISRNSPLDLPFSLGGLSDTVRYKATFAGITESGNIGVNLKVGNNNVGNTSIALTSGDYTYYRNGEASGAFMPGAASFNMGISFTASSVNASLYLDYVLLNYKRPLSLSSGQQLSLRSFEQRAAVGDVVAFNLANANANTRIWNVSNPLSPKQMPAQLSGAVLSFIDSGGVLGEYIAFDGSAYLAPTAIGKIDNQNLHGLSQADYLIITNNDLLPAAERLAAVHRNKFGRTVHVATVDKIYNEFSSGSQDIGGIRNFIRMYYDRGNGTHDLKNILLFGTASFDFKNRIANNTNVVPTYQTDVSSNGNGAYVTDEYFTLLDDGEDIRDNTEGSFIDVGSGRIPARNLDEANNYVAKVEQYISAQSFGEWKLNATFVTDDFEPGMGFLRSSETMSNALDTAYSIIGASKLLADASPRVATPSGIKFPSITRDINNQVFNGTFLMNYIGHGNPTRWAVEEILYQGDIDQWSNFGKLPMVITATCDFGRFDNPLEPSSGVNMVIKKNGGAIMSLTTTQIVYPGPNDRLNAAFINGQFEQNTEGNFTTFGEAFMHAKNAASSSSGTRLNSKKFVVLGDPGLAPALPKHKVVRDSILEVRGDEEVIATDTLKALGRYIIKGHIADVAGNPKTDFNGQVYVTIFDKRRDVSATNPALLASSDPNKTYSLQNSVLFRGNTTVENGEFAVNVIIPKDINYDLGKGKIVYYAFDDKEEAASADTNLVIGEFSSYAGMDNTGPVVKPFIDNNLFRSGDIVSANPMLYVELEDDNGINVSGSSVGHDLIAVIDGDYSNPFILNAFYRTEPNDFSKGNLYYQLSRLAAGRHTITVRAWDVYNNFGEGSTDFEVVESAGLDFNLYNFPNPFGQSTRIVFQHNQPNAEMEVNLRIFGTNGQLVYNQSKEMQPTGSFTYWTWDGTDQSGAKVAQGVYMCQLTIKTSTGISKTVYHKLVFAR